MVTKIPVGYMVTKIPVGYMVTAVEGKRLKTGKQKLVWGMSVRVEGSLSGELYNSFL